MNKNLKYLTWLLLLKRGAERLQRMEGDLLYLAEHDVLTGVFNRYMLEKYLTDAVATAKIEHKMVAVLYLDLDHFKKINDTLGHDIGDQLLQKVAIRLKRALRETDVISRVGGDEFLIVLPLIQSVENVSMISGKLLHAISETAFLNGHEIYITTSIGISLFPDDGGDIQKLMKAADLALYNAKLKGRNNFQFCLPSLAEVARKKMTVEAELHRALKQDAFVLYYQPVVSIERNKMVSLEALIRWQLPDGRIRYPIEFISIAEDSELINRIAEWTLQAICQQIKRWRQQGLHDPTIAMNISAHQLNRHFIFRIKEEIENGHLSPEHFEIEITENVLLQVTHENVELLFSLHDLGVRIFIDDFGTGYSSLSYLRNFKVDAIKIDQCFVKDLITDPNADAIVQTIILLGKSLKIATIAEGVETQEQLNQLEAYGCDFYQGYLYSRALTEQEVTVLLRKKSGGSALEA